MDSLVFLSLQFTYLRRVSTVPALRCHIAFPLLSALSLSSLCVVNQPLFSAFSDAASLFTARVFFINKNCSPPFDMNFKDFQLFLKIKYFSKGLLT